MISSPFKRAGAVALTVGTLALALPAAAQDSEGPDRLNETYRDWVVQCVTQAVSQPQEDAGSARVCEMVQQLTQRDSGQRVLTMGLQRTADGGTAMTVIAPFGILLRDGVTIRVGDDDLFQLEFLTCMSNGCIANADLGSDAVAAMERGSAATVRMSTLQGQALDLEISLMGFTAAMNRLRSLN